MIGQDIHESMYMLSKHGAAENLKFTHIKSLRSLELLHLVEPCVPKFILLICVYLDNISRQDIHESMYMLSKHGAAENLKFTHIIHIHQTDK
ncbi:hypothetical protein HUJ05_013050 [Dendroctonus ponderosae]|nr:hypothetical protein HUJ05_013050 [Dendroctonus ponderosae]